MTSSQTTVWSEFCEAGVVSVWNSIVFEKISRIDANCVNPKIRFKSFQFHKNEFLLIKKLSIFISNKSFDGLFSTCGLTNLNPIVAKIHCKDSEFVLNLLTNFEWNGKCWIYAKLYGTSYEHLSREQHQIIFFSEFIRFIW